MGIGVQQTGKVSNTILNERIIAESGSFVTPISTFYLITAIGAGGSGAGRGGAGGRATGGGAGGFAQKRVFLPSGSTITCTIGAGGAGVTNADGNPGGTTTVTATGISLTANGGQGGTQAVGIGTTTGSIGGTATGGDINVQGGGSGDAVISDVNGHAGTGGGAVGILGVGYSSGVATGAGGGWPAITGGAGVGGKSGDATASIAPGRSRGGSALGASPDQVNQSNIGFPPSLAGGNAASNALPIGFRALNPSTTSGSGSSVAVGVGSGGAFAGGGAVDSVSPVFAGFGGGGGASVDTMSTTNPGGDGVVIIEWMQEI